MKKTYAARGLLEFQMNLDVAGATLKLCFSGGSMGSNGIIPARYSTENEAIQRMIERSPQYLERRIVAVSNYES